MQALYTLLKGFTMSTSDRICPKHGDIGALPSYNNCPQCGQQLVMKGVLRSSAEAIIPAVIIGTALGTGLELGQSLGESIADGISDLF
jgi:hypothetical protein